MPSITALTSVHKDFQRYPYYKERKKKKNPTDEKSFQKQLQLLQSSTNYFDAQYFNFSQPYYNV